jgi:1-acyl-sn-glycerol-3-phosphate acyltransferase
VRVHRQRVRVTLNRLAAAFGLVVGLPAIAIAGRLDARAGRRVAVALVRVLSRVCGVRFEVVGADQLRRGGRYVFVANHASPIDIPALLMALPDVHFLAAADLYRIPLLSSAMRALDTTPIDRHTPTVARHQLREIAARPGPLCLAVFPQGGIAAAGEHRRFKSGAFELAIAAGATVVPVVIRGAARVLPSRAQLGVRPGVVRIGVRPPISTEHLTAADRRALRDRAEMAVTECLAKP